MSAPVYLDVSHMLNHASWVYRYWDRYGECIYVGVSCDTPMIQRAAQHLTSINPSHRKPWAPEVARIDIAAFSDEAEAHAEEKRLIKRLKPKYNQNGKPPPGSSTFDGLEW